MKTGEALLVGGALLIGYTIVTKGTALKRMNFYPDTIHGIGWKNGKVIMEIGMVAQNTSNQQMVIHSLALNITANGNLIGNLSSFDPITISPNSQIILDLSASLSPIGIVTDLIQIFTNHTSTQLIKLDGYANVDNYQVPINIKYSIG